MIWNEFRKIWNIRSVLFVTVVGVTLFYSQVVGQMDLGHLPLFETVQLEIGTELQEKYGNELDVSEMEEVKELYEKAKQDLNEKVMQAHPEIREMGYQSYEEFENALQICREEEFANAEQVHGEEQQELVEEQQRMEESYSRILEEFEREIEVCGTYNEIILANGEITLPSGVVSTLPYQVPMNMRFVMEEYSLLVLLLVLILVLPYLAMDNRMQGYPIVAATKTGRRLVVYQMAAVLLAVLLLLAVCNIVFYIVYRIMAPYEPFSQCLVPNLWFGWTWQQYFWIRIGMMNLGAIACAMIFFFVSSMCRTIVGTVVMAVPCWGMSSILSYQYFCMVFQDTRNRPFFSYTIGRVKYLSFVVEALLLAVGIGLFFLLYHRRKVQDIV